MARIFMFVPLLAALSFYPLAKSSAQPRPFGQSGSPALQLGDLLPQIAGQTPTGKSLDVPEAARHKISVVIFSFSRAAGKDAHRWNERLAGDFTRLPRYNVIMLGSVPRLFRGFALSGIKGSMPPSVQDRTIVWYRDEDLWKRRLGVADEDRAYLVVLGTDSRIRWMSATVFTERECSQLNKALQRLLQTPQ